MSPKAATCRPKASQLVADAARWEVRATGEPVGDEAIEALATWLIQRAERRLSEGRDNEGRE